MKVLFLDVDGVLNNDNTKEKVIDTDTGQMYTGVDKKLAEMFVAWFHAQPPLSIVLSSTWRLFPGMHHALHDVGIHWRDITPSRYNETFQGGPGRGNEIVWWLDQHPEVTHYAILDDMAPNHFLPSHRDYLVQTDERVGLTKNDLIKMSKILFN